MTTKDKWFMRGKDILLLVIGSGAVIALVHIWELPKAVEAIYVRLTADEVFASSLDRRTLILETNMSNQTALLQDIRHSVREKINQ